MLGNQFGIEWDRKAIKDLYIACLNHTHKRREAGKSTTVFELMCEVPGLFEIAHDSPITYGQLNIALAARCNVINTSTAAGKLNK